MVEDKVTVFVMDELARYNGLDNCWEELQSTRLKACLQFEEGGLCVAVRGDPAEHFPWPHLSTRRSLAMRKATRSSYL